jgi:hypothetical protein
MTSFQPLQIRGLSPLLAHQYEWLFSAVNERYAVPMAENESLRVALPEGVPASPFYTPEHEAFRATVRRFIDRAARQMGP